MSTSFLCPAACSATEPATERFPLKPENGSIIMYIGIGGLILLIILLVILF